MAMTVKQLKEWVETLNPDNMVAIDDFGLTLVEITPDRVETEAYLEIGGIPEDEDVENSTGE